MEFEFVRRDLTQISSDKGKMTMEGTLRLEEKMSRIEQGLERDTKKVLNEKLAGVRSGWGM